MPNALALPLVLMLLTEPELHKQLRRSLMRQLFDITVAEANLASALMVGARSKIGL